MSIQKASFRPGINRQVTATLNEGGWTDGNLVRFRDGLPQPVGGWVKAIQTAFPGVCRAIRAWAALDGTRIAALGTSAALYLFRGGAFVDITPATLAAGMADVPYGSGWGAGPFGAGAFGVPRGGVVAKGTLRLWSLDTWGEELLACPRNGAIYNWRPAAGYGTKAAAVTGAPDVNKGVFTGMPERHVIAFGSSTGGVQDPLLVRWSDVEDYTSWTASATNSAGSYRLVGGTEIMGWAAAPQEILVWTDSVLYAMRFQGLPYVYGFFQQGTACGLLAPNAAAVIAGTAYWMGRDGFWAYAGQVRPLPCTVWDEVFRNRNTQQDAKITAGVNAGFTEVTWFYPSASSIENDRYVTFDLSTGTWSLGALARTAWADAGAFPRPMAASPVGILYAHETGADADGQPMGAYVQSGFFDLGAGEAFSFVDQVMPDFADHAGPVDITLSAQAAPNGPVSRKGPFPVLPGTRYLSPRLRGRQVALRIGSSALGAFWRLGALRLRITGDGRR